MNQNSNQNETKNYYWCFSYKPKNTGSLSNLPNVVDNLKMEQLYCVFCQTL